jgi:hypothetical protein
MVRYRCSREVFTEPFHDWNLTVDRFDSESSGHRKNRIIRVQEALANYSVTTPLKS